MANNKLITIFFCFVSLFVSIASSNAQSIHFPESIVVKMNTEFGLTTTYVVQEKNTLYSICKFYECNLQELKSLNPSLDMALIEPGDELIIPFRNQLLDNVAGNPSSQHYIPVYYKTAPKDNLFRISHGYFNRDLNTIRSLNKLSNHDLQPGQLLLVGWKKKSIFDLPLEKDEMKNTELTETSNENRSGRAVYVKTIQPDSRSEEADSFQVESKEMGPADEIEKILEKEKSTDNGSISTKHIVQQNGLAIWNKDSRSTGSFALHNEAVPGTLLEITNPQLNRKAFVKVIGRIPDNAYQDNVKVILSPEAAKTLGALDSRFYVRMNYITQ